MFRDHLNNWNNTRGHGSCHAVEALFPHINSICKKTYLVQQGAGRQLHFSYLHGRPGCRTTLSDVVISGDGKYYEEFCISQEWPLSIVYVGITRPVTHWGTEILDPDDFDPRRLGRTIGAMNRGRRSESWRGNVDMCLLNTRCGIYYCTKFATGTCES